MVSNQTGNRLLVKKILWSGLQLKLLLIVSLVVLVVGLMLGLIIGNFGVFLISVVLMQLFFIVLGISLSLASVIPGSLRALWLYSSGDRLELFKTVELQYMMHLAPLGIFLALMWIGYSGLNGGNFEILPQILWVSLGIFLSGAISFYVMFLSYGRIHVEWAKAITISTSFLLCFISLGIFYADKTEVAVPDCPKKIVAFVDGLSIEAPTKEALIQKGIDPAYIVELKQTCYQSGYAPLPNILNADQSFFGTAFWLPIALLLCCLLMRWLAVRYWIRVDLIRVPKRV